MTRSTARTRLVAASVGALGVLVAALLAGCGAGQQAQTSRMQAAVPGTNANIVVPGGVVGLRDLTVAFPGDNGYPQGSTAPLQVRILNSSEKPVTLTGVRVAPVRTDNSGNNATPVDGTVVLVGSPSAAPTGAGPANASATTGSDARSSLSAGPTNPAGTGEAVPSPTATPSAGGSASPGATAVVPPPTSSATPAGSSTINITIPVGGYVLLAPAYGTYLAVADLSREIRYGDVINLEFRFGDVTSVVSVPLNTPVSRGPRTPLPTDVPE